MAVPGTSSDVGVTARPGKTALLHTPAGTDKGLNQHGCDDELGGRRGGGVWCGNLRDYGSHVPNRSGIDLALRGNGASEVGAKSSWFYAGLWCHGEIRQQ